MKNPLIRDKRPVAPASVPEQLAAITASLVRIEARLDRLQGVTPAAPNSEAPEQRAERHDALARKIAEEGKEA